jgi:hypothetical protein
MFGNLSPQFGHGISFFLFLKTMERNPLQKKEEGKAKIGREPIHNIHH